MLWEDILEEYDAGEFYDDYIKEFIELNISSDALEATMKEYLDSGEEDRPFEFYVSEYGFTDGTQPLSFREFFDEEFPALVLASELESYIFERNEYAKQQDDRLPWVEGYDRFQTEANIRKALDNDPKALLDYFKVEYLYLPVDDKRLPRAEVLLKELQEYCGEDRTANKKVSVERD